MESGWVLLWTDIYNDYDNNDGDDDDYADDDVIDSEVGWVLLFLSWTN